MLIPQNKLAPKPTPAMRKVNKAAQKLTADDVFKQGEFLGAGLMGGAYRLKHQGKSLVVKQLGHPESVTGMLGTHTRRQLELKAQKQAAVQNALVMAGFPAPASAVLKDDPTWVVMEEARGLHTEQLSKEEKVEGQRALESLRGEATPTVSRVLAGMRKQHPDHEDLFLEHIEGGATYTRTEEGLIISGYFDPVV